MLKKKKILEARKRFVVPEPDETCIKKKNVYDAIFQEDLSCYSIVLK